MGESFLRQLLTIFIQFQMNIIQPLPAQFPQGDLQQGEQNQEQTDPLNELNPITLLKKPDEFKQAFFTMTNISLESFKSKNYERASLALLKCVDMLDLGKNILKDINKFWKIVVYGNLACCYHYTRKLSKCNKFCEKIKEELQKIINQSQQKEMFLKLSRILIKLKFQHCAILSQLQQHQKAFQLCKSTLSMLKQSIQMLLSYIQQSSSSNLLEKKSTETVQFSRQVYRFGQGLLNDLLKCLNEPLKDKERNAFYYWQKNPEQNQEQVKKKFILNGQNNTCKRSILGVSKSTHWIDQFNIGTIMHFSEMNITDFDNPIPMEEYLFKDRLYQLVIYCSMAHFTMATELRLIQSTQQEKSESNHQISSQINLMKKYGYEQKSELFKLSEIYHLRSIDIMARNIKTTVPYITHIIRSYEKHYIKQKKVLEPIAAIVEESALSINESKDEKLARQQEEPYYQTNYNRYIYKNYEQILNDKHEYGEIQPFNQLLLQSQNYKTQGQITMRPPVVELSQKKESNSPTSLEMQGNSKKLTSVKSAENLMKPPVESPGCDEPNTSDEYLKSHRANKSSSKVKKSGIRQKSTSKMPMIKPIGGPFKDIKKQTKERIDKKVDYEKNNEYKLKTQRPMDKNKQKERKTIKKQKLLDLDSDKYGQKQIKIKTESCTHIKVVYKKKK